MTRVLWHAALGAAHLGFGLFCLVRALDADLAAFAGWAAAIGTLCLVTALTLASDVRTTLADWRLPA